MRPLNKMELQALKRLANLGKLDESLRALLLTLEDDTSSFNVHYISRQEGNKKSKRPHGNTTICTVDFWHGSGPMESSSSVWIGVSRRSYKDKPNRTKGNMLAFIRAITNPPITV